MHGNLFLPPNYILSVCVRAGVSTSTQYLGTNTSTLNMFKYKYKYRVLRNVLGYYPSTLQMYFGTITKYQVQMHIITHTQHTVKCINKETKVIPS